MGVWSLLLPNGTEDANTLHTIIQTAKVDIMERMKVTNADTLNEHTVYDTTATGRHPLSLVGFVDSHADLAALVTAHSTIFPKAGTLHFTVDTNRLYVGRNTVIGSTDPLDSIELVSTTDHGEYTGLDEDDHTQYILLDGTRVMTGDLTIDAAGVLDVTTIEVADDQPIHADHTLQSWFDAHGASSVIETSFAANSFTGLFTTAINSVNSGSTLDFCISAVANVPTVQVLSFQATSNGYITRDNGTVATKKSSLSSVSRSI